MVYGYVGGTVVRCFTWEFPTIRGTLFRVLIIRILLFRYYIRVPYFRKLPYAFGQASLDVFTSEYPLKFPTFVKSLKFWKMLKIRVFEGCQVLQGISIMKS